MANTLKIREITLILNFKKFSKINYAKYDFVAIKFTFLLQQESSSFLAIDFSQASQSHMHEIEKRLFLQ